MDRRIPEPDPYSEFEDEGIPDLEDSFPERKWNEDPQRAPLPGDRPVGLDAWGTTPEEVRQREPLDRRLRREEPDNTRVVGGRRKPPQQQAGRIVEEDEGVRSDTEDKAVAYEAGPDLGGFSAEEAAMRIRGGEEAL